MKKRRILPVIFAAVVVVMMMNIMICVLSVRVEATVPGGIISDGIYALQNKGTGKYLDIQKDSTEEGMYIQQYQYGSTPSGESERSGLFKFTHRGLNGYIIRTMRNNGNSFYRMNDYEVKTTAIDPIDANNLSDDNWYLSDAGGGYYYLESNEPNKYLCAPPSGVNSGKYCTTEDCEAAGDRAKWALIEYPGSAFSGAKVNYLEPQVISMGSSILIHPVYLEQVYFYSTVLGENTFGSYVGFQTLSPSNGQTSNIAEVSGYFLVNKPNKAGMTAVAIEYSNVTTEPFNIYIKPNSDNYIFLQNIQSSTGYVESNGTYASKAYFDYDDNQIWQKVDAGSGYYYIRNMDGKYLTAPASTSPDLDIGLESSLLTGTNLKRQKWKFENALSGSGAMRIKAESSGNYNRCLGISSTNNKLIQLVYNNDTSYDDEFNVITLGNNVVYHRTFSDFSYLDTTEIVQNLCGHYDGFELIHMKNQLGQHDSGSIACHKIALDLLENSKVMVFSGHGNATLITISDYNQHHWLKRSHLSAATVDLSSVDIVIFEGCSTAGTPSYGYNLTKTAANAGAKVAIGWSENVTPEYQTTWINEFFSFMNTAIDATQQMHTAAEAVNHANNILNGSASSSAEIYGTNPNFSYN